MRISTILIIILIAACKQQPPANTTGIEFIKIEPGSFVYGKFDPPFPRYDSSREGYSSEDYKLAEQLAKADAMPGFTVKIERPFSIGKYEVTQLQWQKVMGNNPSTFKGDSLPVQNVSWNDAQNFMQKLNESDRDHHYRLPTEFEWEYAARAGAVEDIAWDTIRQHANISVKEPASVGTKQANEWGLYDMLGNVWEWTTDVYNEKIFADQTPATSGSEHVLKGASFVGDVKNATYMTHAAGPGNGWDVGFRVLMEDVKTEIKPVELSTPKDGLNGWHVSRTTHQGTTPEVKINNGEITLKQHPYGQAGVLLTNKKYRDFDLTLEVKIDSFCNSGIFLRSSESGQGYQVELAEPGGTGSLFGEMMSIGQPAKADQKSKVWKANDWNEFRIRMTGEVPRIILWINGKQMWDVTQPANDFTAGATEGMIGLANPLVGDLFRSSKSI